MTNASRPYYAQWTDCHTMLGDDFSYIRLDLGLHRLLPAQDKQNTFRVMVKLLSPHKEGDPEDVEIELLNRMGEALADNFGRQFDMTYIGYIAADKVCGFYFCVDSVFDTERIVEEVMNEFPEYKYKTTLFENDSWETYTDCLFPGFQYSERIQDGAVVTRLEKQGDTLLAARPVSHWFYFRNGKDREAFLEEVLKEGFDVENYSEDLQCEDWPYGVHLSRIDHVDRKRLFTLTSHLWELAYRHFGNYDGWKTVGVVDEQVET